MLFYNEDWMHFIWTRYNANIDVSEEILKEYIYSFKGTQVTDFALNVNGTVSNAPSKILETFVDKYNVTEENGIKVNYKDSFARKAYEIFAEKNIDMYAVWIDALREIGVNPWISVRVNDCHANCEKTEIRKSSMVEKYSKYNVSAYRESIGYFDRCFDYSFDEVRKTVLSYIDEMLDRYEVNGLELDLTREMVLFKPGFEDKGRKIFKNFIFDVSKLLDKYHLKYGHIIKLSLLVHQNPYDCFNKGVDVLSFIEKVDYISIISRWDSTDTDMPIELWKQLFGDNIKLGGGQQLLVAPYPRNWATISSVKMAFGQAIANLSRGCDFVYLYNYMDMGGFEGEIANWKYDDSIKNDANLPLIFKNIGKRETLLKQERSHPITYCDFAYISSNRNYLLPLEFSGKENYYQLLRFSVGEIPKDKKVRLILGINDDSLGADDFSVYVNSSKCEYSESINIESKIYPNKCYVFDIKENYFDIFIAELRISKPCKIEYAEIEVI